MTNMEIALVIAPFGTLAAIIPLLVNLSRRLGQLEGRIDRLEAKLDVALELWRER